MKTGKLKTLTQKLFAVFKLLLLLLIVLFKLWAENTSDTMLSATKITYSTKKIKNLKKKTFVHETKQQT